MRQHDRPSELSRYRRACLASDDPAAAARSPTLSNSVRVIATAAMPLTPNPTQSRWTHIRSNLGIPGVKVRAGWYEMELVGPDIVRPEQVWRLAEVAGELGDLLQIRPLRVRREIADLHVLGHALAEWCHGRLLCEMKRATGAAPWSRNRGRQKMGK